MKVMKLAETSVTLQLFNNHQIKLNNSVISQNQNILIVILSTYVFNLKNWIQVIDRTLSYGFSGP